jgi:hypothetical protein
MAGKPAARMPRMLSRAPRATAAPGLPAAEAVQRRRAKVKPAQKPSGMPRISA